MISQTILAHAYEVYSWGEIAAATFRLAQAISASKQNFDRVVALARGGVSIAQSLSDQIDVKRISVIQSELYSGIELKAKSPIITQPLAANIKGEKILLIDDLADTGETLVFAKRYLLSHGPSDVKTATLAKKPWAKVVPDYWDIESKAWVIFPWETRETITTLIDLWVKKGVKPTAIASNLGKLGYNKEQIETFSSA